MVATWRHVVCARAYVWSPRAESDFAAEPIVDEGGEVGGVAAVRDRLVAQVMPERGAYVGGSS